MDELLKWIKANMKEGAKVEEVEKLVKELDPLGKIKTKEDALKLIKDNGFLNSALDSETSLRVDNALKK